MKTVFALVAACLLAAPVASYAAKKAPEKKQSKKVSSAKPKSKPVSSARPQQRSGGLVLNHGLDGTPFYSSHRVLSFGRR